MTHQLYKTIFASSLLICSAQAFSAGKSDQHKPFAAEMFDETSAVVDFELTDNALRNVVVSVSGPRDFYKKQDLAKAALNLDDGELDDGVYNYEVTARTNKKIQLRKDRPNNGRGEKERDFVYESVSQSGHFRVANGKIVIVNETLPEPELTVKVAE